MNGPIDNARVLWRCWRERRRRNRAEDEEAIASNKPPVPGRRREDPPPAPWPPAQRPPAPGQDPGAGLAAGPPVPHAAEPAPGLPPRHGGRVKTVELWADGRVVITDHRTRTTETRPGWCPDCRTDDDLDEELRRLTP